MSLIFGEKNSFIARRTNWGFCFIPGRHIYSMTAAFNDEFVHQVEQMSRFQEQTHKLTSKCWDLCVDKPETRLGSRAETCLKNCVERFIDINNLITNRFQKSLMERLAVTASLD